MIIIENGPILGQSYVTANRNVGAWLKQFAGCLWRPEELKRWRVPNELIVPLCAACTDMTEEVRDLRTQMQRPQDLPNDLLPWQSEAVSRVLTEGTLLVGFETGLGKSRTAIEVIKQVGGRAVIVCPASVRATWEIECGKWGLNSEYVQVLWTGKDEIAPHAMVVIVSYEWIRDHGALLENAERPVGVLVYDEIHYVKNGKKSKGERRSRSEAVVALSEAHPLAYKIGLSATVVANEVQDIWHQMHVLSPGRWSSWFRFVKEYCVSSEGDYGGIIVEGVNPSREDELKYRIDSQMIRKTKAEISHLLPPVMVKIDWQRAKGQAASYQVETLEHNALEMFSTVVAPTKVGLVVGDVLDAYASGERRHVLITHLISTAETLAACLRQKLTECWGSAAADSVVCITGDVPTKKRTDMVRNACVGNESIIVATMHSIGVGIDDLKSFKNVTFVEMYWSPQVMIQTLGRFCRIGAPGGDVTVRLLALRGTVDEALALALESKINAALKIGGVGDDGAKLVDGLGADDMSEDSFLEMLREQTSEITTHDEYGVDL